MRQDFVVFSWLKRLHQGMQLRAAHFWRTREVLNVTRQMQAGDFNGTPVRLWPQLRAQHRVELDAIRAGKLAFVDRRTQTNTGLPYTLNRLNQPVPKQAPISLRRFARTPVVSRALNTIKAGLLGLSWKVEVIDGKGEPDDPDIAARIEVATDCFSKPNNDETFREWCEQLITDFLTYGMATAELRNNPLPERPVKLWAVDTSTIQIVPDWTEGDDDRPRYAQVLPNAQSNMAPLYLLNDELLTIRDNIATDSPFGTGCVEIAYRVINDLLGVQRMAGIAGNDQIGRQIFWWNGITNATTIDDLRAYLQNELEGMARVGVIGGMPKPDVVEVQPTSIDDLLLPWQEMLIRMIACAFNLSAMALNTTNDVNRAVGMVLSDMDFRTAVVPIAKRFQETFTRDVLERKMGYEDLRFVFQGLDDPDLETKISMLDTLFNMGCRTPNEICDALGMKKSKSPFANLTNFEMILLNTEMTQIIKQTQAQSPMGGPEGGDPQPGDEGQYGEDGQQGVDWDSPMQQQAAAALRPHLPKVKLRQPKLHPPKMPKPRLPKLKQFSAERIAGMSPAYIESLRTINVLPKSAIVLAQEMEDESPGVLEQLSDEVWQYLESLAQNEIEKSQTRKVVLNKKWTKIAEKRYGKDVRRITKMDQLTSRGPAGGQKSGRSRSVKAATSRHLKSTDLRL